MCVRNEHARAQNLHRRIDSKQFSNEKLCVWKYQINKKNEMLFVRNNWTEKKINKIIVQHILKVCTRTQSHTIAVTKKWANTKKMKISKLKRSKWAASKRQKRQQQTTTANNRQLRSTVHLWGDGNGRRAEPRKNRRKTILNIVKNNIAADVFRFLLSFSHYTAQHAHCKCCCRRRAISISFQFNNNILIE